MECLRLIDVAYKSDIGSSDSVNQEPRRDPSPLKPDKQPPPKEVKAENELAFTMRDFLNPLNLLNTESVVGASISDNIPFIDDSAEEGARGAEDGCERETEEVLNNAACRLRRWRAASRKLRRPRIINNLSQGARGGGGGCTDLADRLRSLAAVDMAGSGQLLSLAPPPPAATAPPSPGFLLTPSLAEQSSVEYFGSSPECCADTVPGLSSAAGAPAPPPGPRYKLTTEGAARVCCFQHTRTVVDKILATKFLRRWETHQLALQVEHIVSKTPSGLLDAPLAYTSIQELYCISRWDPARKYCLRMVVPEGSLLLQANDAYTRDQWYHSIVWRRNIVRYRKFLTKTIRKEVVLKELKNMVDFVMRTPLQDELVTRAPMEIITRLLAEDPDSAEWEEWAESITSCSAPLLAERCAGGELCRLLAALCRRRPRMAPLPALGPPVRRVLHRNVDFARAPHARQLVRDYISALSAQNAGSTLIRRFVEMTHGPRGACPHPRAAPNLAAVVLGALDEHYRGHAAPHVCGDEERVMCFADILEHMCEYEDWLAVVAAVMQPVPLCEGALRCPRVAKRLGRVLRAVSADARCAVHACVAPARAARANPPSWLRACGPGDALLALPYDDLCELWGEMLTSLLKCCFKMKSFLQSCLGQLPDIIVLALRQHPAALEALCLMLEWDVASAEETQLEIIAALQGSERGQQHYRALCARQESLERTQSTGGPRSLALPARASDADVAALTAAGALGDLQCLSLAFTAVTSDCAEHLIKLRSLRYLNLWATQFGDSGLRLIAEHLPHLQVLNLCETPVSDKGIEALSALPNLRRLNLNSTALTAETFDQLRRRLPLLQDYDVRYTEAWRWPLDPAGIAATERPLKTPPGYLISMP